ncbi:MAG: O-antigen ligase family protein [Phycisphaerae bacterium]
MTTDPQVLASFDPFDRGPSIASSASSSQRLSPLAWVIHFVLFLTMMICVVLPDILGASPRVLMIRQITYVGYAVFMLVVGSVSASSLVWRDISYLACTVAISLAALTTLVTVSDARYIDYLGPVSFVLGVYVFAFVLPRAFRSSTATIVLPCALIVTAVVCVGSYFRTGAGLERNNMVSAYAGLTTLLLALRGQRRGISLAGSILCWGGVAVLLLILATSLGRTAIFACVGTGLLLTWLGSTSRRKLMVFLLLLLVLCLALWTRAGGHVVEALLSKGQDWERLRFTLTTLSGRTEIWANALHGAGFSWFGHGTSWVNLVTERGAHSSYLTVYFAYGFLALFFWLIMCMVSLWAAVRTMRACRRSASFPLAPALVLYYLIMSLAESYFNLLVGGFAMLFYVGTGMCMLELHKTVEDRSWFVPQRAY